jgi:CheY-like chemotaxis protein/GAF domain-containing protein
MTNRRPRLLLPVGTLPASSAEADNLKSAFDVVEIERLDDPAAIAAVAAGGAFLLLAPAAGPLPTVALPGGGIAAVLEHVGEGVGLVTAGGDLAWASQRLRDGPAGLRRRFVEACRSALQRFEASGDAALPPAQRPVRRVSFETETRFFDAVVSIAAVDEGGAVRSVVGTLWDTTEGRRLQQKIDAIDAAGSELMRIESATIEKLNMAERLSFLERRIVRAAQELLHFDNFEVRLIDRETKRLELVFAVGLAPLKIGHVIYAEPEGNGISGWVAATGESYICRDARRDPRYIEGLDNAGSSLTVPLRLFDRVIGVFNVEAREEDAFTDADRQFAEIFGRYIAMAMHILDLLVVERYMTNEQITQNVLSELDDPLEDVGLRAAALEAAATDEATRSELARIVAGAERVRRRLRAATAGPKSIIGAEKEIEAGKRDPLLEGKRVLLADNEPIFLEALSNLLRAKGCEVTACAGGLEVIEKITTARERGASYDLVISDIRMPDRNGYEVFRATRQHLPGTPVILVTGFGYDPHHSIVRATQEGLHAFLFKPLKVSQLLEVVTAAVTTPAK